MSVLALKADIRQRKWHVRYVPEADLDGMLIPPALRAEALAKRRHTSVRSEGRIHLPASKNGGLSSLASREHHARLEFQHWANTDPCSHDAHEQNHHAPDQRGEPHHTEGVCGFDCDLADDGA